MCSKRVSADIGQGQRREICCIMIIILMALYMKEHETNADGIKKRLDLEKTVTFREQSLTGGVIKAVLVLMNRGQKTGVVDVDLEMTGFVDGGVVLAEEIQVDKEGKKAMAFGTIVGGIKTMDGTKTSRKVNIFETNSPAKGSNLGLVTTIRSSHEIRRRESRKGGNRNILRGHQSINNIIVACGNMQVLKEKLTPPKER